MTIENAVEKINKVLNSLPEDAAIEAYQKCGERLHQRIEAKQNEAAAQLGRLSGFDFKKHAHQVYENPAGK